jgi:energy-coupling factor transporter ATP-binding protein EcfA2
VNQERNRKPEEEERRRGEAANCGDAPVRAKDKPIKGGQRDTMATHSCKIKKWKPEEAKSNRIFLIVGRRGSGKTVLLRHLMYIMKDRIDFAIAFCPTVESRNMLKEHLPEACVYDRLVQSKVDDTVAAASQLAAKGVKRKFLLIFDDVLYEKAAFRTKAIRELFFNGRHYGCAALILTQYLVDIEPSLRSNVDFCVTFKDNILSNKMRLWKYMFGLLSTMDDFVSVHDRCTQNYECLVLDNTGASSAVSDSLFWYTANTTLPKFRVGSGVFFKLTEQMRRPPGSTAPVLLEGYEGGKKARLQVVKEDEAEKGGSSDEDGR